MGWLCSNCSVYNDDASELCIVCDSRRPDVKRSVLTRTVANTVGGMGDVIIPISYNVIGENAFKNRTDVNRIIIHESVTAIEKGAFSGCVNLREIVCYASLQKISTKAFYNCTSLSEEGRPTAEYVAPDAFSSTVSELLSSSSGLAGEHTDYLLRGGEGKIAFERKQRTVPVWGEDEEEESTPAAASVTPPPPSAFCVEVAPIATYETKPAPEEYKVETNAPMFLKASRSTAKASVGAKSLVACWADGVSITAVIAVIATVVLGALTLTGVLNNNLFVSISEAIAISAIVFSAMFLIGSKHSFYYTIYLFNGVIALLLSAATCLLFIFVAPTLGYFATAFGVTGAITCVISTICALDDFEEGMAIFSAIAGAISLVGAVVSFIFVL